MPEANQFFRRLKQHGYKITPQRQAILQCLLDNPGHHSAEEIHQIIKTHYPHISLDTVYRNLHTMVALGLVIALNFADGRNRYELATEEHHHHLICLSCGQSEQIDFCPLSYMADTISRERNFTICKHSFEIYGYCHNCRQNQK
ncbi:MAG: Fur family transcriptional regulator [Bacillota bacterium]|uniref:Fur family transcriptional regulator n=1 Tax=Desulfurispora thermophila TaxID=265470 RepID=UPI00036B81F3|nr:Fur family transcriptional regulator [Desulfurispora thermophila]